MLELHTLYTSLFYHETLANLYLLVFILHFIVEISIGIFFHFSVRFLPLVVLSYTYIVFVLFLLFVFSIFIGLLIKGRLDNTEVSIKYGKSMQRNWQHRVHKTKTNETKNTTQYVLDTTICKRIQNT